LQERSADRAMTGFRNSAQSLTELAIMFVVIVAAFGGMQLYLQRSYQARYKNGADYLFLQIEAEANDRKARGEKTDHLTKLNRQYTPYYRESAITTVRENFTIRKGYNATALDYSDDINVDQTSKRYGWEKTGSAAYAD